MSKRIIIISGGELNEEFVLSILEKEENQYVIGVDMRYGVPLQTSDTAELYCWRFRTV